MQRYAYGLTLLFVAGCGDSTSGGDRGYVDLSSATDGGTGEDLTQGGGGDLARRDGGGGPDGGGVMVVQCPKANLPALAKGVCEVKKGGDAKLITATVLRPGEILRGGQVLVDAQGKIACAACDCSAQAAGATEITCPQGVLSPGLINTHDHITFQSSPRADSGERYEQRHDWRKGIRGHTSLPAGNTASGDQVRFAELRFLVGGATATVGSGSANGLLRNLDRNEPAQGGLMQKPVDFDTFPLGDSSGTQAATGCATYKIKAASEVMAEDAYFPHVSEGIDQVSRNEFLCVSSSMGGGQDLAQPQSAFIHSIGLKPPDYAIMAQDSVSLVWSPRSNIRLYGDTAVVTEAARLGVLITLGTDWLPSGSMNLLRELRCADDLNQKYYGRYFTDEELWLMVTRNAALATATDDVIGVIRKDLRADLAIFDGRKNRDHRAVIAAEPADVVLVLRDGKALYGDSGVAEAIPGAAMCEGLDLCGVAKQVCIAGDLGGVTFAQLKTAVGANNYPLFFCGPPMNEPTCVPSRPKGVAGSTVYSGVISPGDSDGDGIPNGMDNCPQVFNPVRPVDAGKQGDQDGDGLGDSCDPCPFDKVGVNCKPFDAKDADGDGVPSVMDNCPSVANADQKDADMDMKGDACDSCPMDPNPGDQGCPATVYAIKTGKVAVDAIVSVKGVLVTAVHGNGFVVQVKEGDPGYLGADNSAVYVYAPMAMVKVGDRIDLTLATVANYQGQIQLTKVTFKVTASGVAGPKPISEKSPGVPLVAADLAMGAKAQALEGVVVTLAPAVVTDVDPPPGMGDAAPTNELAVDALRVDDLFFLLPKPLKGEAYVSITGVLLYRHGLYKLEPRSDADVALGPPRLTALGPDGFVRVGQMGVPAIPAPLVATMSRAVLADTVVTLAAADPMSLGVPMQVTIPKGMAKAPVPVSGLVRTAMGVKVTATVAGVMASATVRVLDAMEAPKVVGLDPTMATVAPGGKVQLTVSLDIPAPGPTMVALTSTTMGTVPATVTVDKDQLSASFTYQQMGMLGSDTVTATLGGASKSSTVKGQGHLVINEVDYDQPGSDEAEFIELHNPTAAPLDLTNLAVVLINGSGNTEYARIELKGMLEGGGYLVLGTKKVMVDVNATLIVLGAATDNLQNGAPDGVAVINKMTGEVVDALSYEGSITMAAITGLKGARSLVEGKPTMATDLGAGSLIRWPNGADGDDASVDWALTMAPTPGAANVKQ